MCQSDGRSGDRKFQNVRASTPAVAGSVLVFAQGQLDLSIQWYVVFLLSGAGGFLELYVLCRSARTYTLHVFAKRFGQWCNAKQVGGIFL